ncbi:hypothetical protein G5C51_31645 [Streptomyces sp. A7024]|uniref:Uncharacterized protein n=1 Tax=Streptomyces coryli TaxID=1128680 RepID=A0A6G4UAM7_9ACTN|nr:hypothetical protein [Streptomyces coryli]NGN68438.1 hypothetical protein [Streptomyces coryli]
MAHTDNPHQQRGPTAHLPAPRQDQGAVEQVQNGQPPAFARDLVRSLDVATAGVRALADRGQASDVSVSALTALECNGATPADALQAAADVVRQSPALEPHGIALAKIPGRVEGMWEYVVTMTVSTRDPQTGEYGGASHHADRPREHR